MTGFISLAFVLCGLVAANPMAAVTPAELAARVARNEPLFIIDVRSATAYSSGHVPGAMNIPLGLLPYKQIPSSQPVIVYGDGLGVIDDAQALAVIRSKPGVRAEVIEGGYAAWLSETRLTTVPAGVGPEKLPGITYDQLIAASKGDMVLVDLRSIAVAASAAASPRKERLVAAEAAPDVLTAFAAKIGVPIVAPNGSVAAAKVSGTSANTAAAPARAAAPVTGGSGSGRLMVLVADNDSAASEAARQLRASGQYRFTILIGGTESISHEGRIGTGRMDGSAPAPTR
jgi:rhodanese-related sulfurtransferase